LNAIIPTNLPLRPQKISASLENVPGHGVF